MNKFLFFAILLFSIYTSRDSKVGRPSLAKAPAIEIVKEGGCIFSILPPSLATQSRGFGALGRPTFESREVYLHGEEMTKFTEPTQAMAFERGKTYIATIHTSKGEIVCELNSESAPLSVTNFIQLAKGGFYNGLTFHRVVQRFVIQGGDPEGTGSGGPGYTLPAEISLAHDQGALAWARLPDQVNPQKRSSGSQFYITLEKVPYLDGEYSVFGKTISGMEVVKKIAQGDVIQSIEIRTENRSR